MLHMHLRARLEVFLQVDDASQPPYVAQVTMEDDGGQMHGRGSTAREAIHDAIAERNERMGR